MSTDIGTLVDGVVVKDVCFSHHGDWTGTHRREPSCPPAKWFINECGDVYDYAPELQAEHFPNDDHRVFDTQEEAELAAAISAPGPIEAEIRRRLDEADEHETDPDPASGGVPLMAYEEAISYAIFAINTIMEPQASSDTDVARLELHSDEIIASLVDIRDTMRTLGS